MSFAEFVLLFFAGGIASGINAVAGGGSLISFPVLTLGLHIPDRFANATNSVGLFPGSFAGGLGLQNQLSNTKKYLRVLTVPTVLGSFGGALLLLNTTDKSFRAAVPFLILLASILLLLQPTIKAKLEARLERKGGTPSPWTGPILQFLVAIYGGYFGAGMGIMMLAAFSLFMEGDLHEINAVKNWLGCFINMACSAVFVLKGLVILPHVFPLMLGGFAGGFAAARLSQRVNANLLRRLIAGYGLVMTAYFLYRMWA